MPGFIDIPSGCFGTSLSNLAIKLVRPILVQMQEGTDRKPHGI